MIPAMVALGTLLTLALGSAIRRRDQKPDVRFDVNDPEFHAMIRRISRRDSGGMGRID